MHNAHVVAYYNAFDKRLLKDYIHGNLRVQAAIDFVLNRVPEGSNYILDIGCGIGWSSYELALNFPEATILGIDISDELLEIAGRLFKAPNLSFQKVDVAADSLQFVKNKVDAVVLIDVYEHIPAAARGDFNQRIASLLSDKGRVLLTCPTPSFLSYLKLNHPEQIQPVDEDISLGLLQQFAHTIGGEVVYYHNVHVWNTNDYFHCELSREHGFGTHKKQAEQKCHLTQAQRLELVQHSVYKDEIDQVSTASRASLLRRIVNKLKAA